MIPRTWSEMRGEEPGRSWLRFSEAMAALASEGVAVTATEFRREVKRAGRPERRYGHYRYTEQHLEAVRAFARQAITTEGEA